MRYLVLVLLNAPIVMLALVNIITQYKLKKVTSAHFRHQIVIWTIILAVIVSSFPVYNLMAGKPLLDSSELSLFDIIQTTAIVLLLYIINGQRQRNDRQEQRLRELHQELSIILSRR